MRASSLPVDWSGLVNQTNWVVIVNIQDAKTNLSALVARAESGEDIVIARAGRPVLRLVPVDGPPPRNFGGLSFVVPEDFDAPLPDEELAAWE